MDDLPSLAIKKSLEGNWKDAIEINRRIIQADPTNTEALCRLAKAYTETGKLKEAVFFYQKVIRVDPLNQIAKRNVERLKLNKSSQIKPPHSERLGSSTFIEEPGKTKTVSLVKLASHDVINRLDPGDQLKLTAHQHSISVCLSDGTTIGRLPDDLAARLLPMIKSGNLYSALARSVNFNTVKILLREEKRSKKYQATSSFSLSDHASYQTYNPPEISPDDQLASTTEDGPSEDQPT